MQDSVNTDRRLVTLVSGGTRMLVSIDPRGLLSAAAVSGLSIDLKLRSWKLRLLTNEGKIINIYGAFNSEGENILERITLRSSPDDTVETELKLLPEKNLFTALGDLSRIPARLRGVMALKPGANTEKTESFALTDYAKTAINALFWRLDCKNETKDREPFLQYRFKYDSAPGEETLAVDFAAIRPVKDGTIMIRTEADVFGLKNKRVILDKELGLGHKANIACTVKKQDFTVPSLTVALDLAKVVGTIYTDERKRSSKIVSEKSKTRTITKKKSNTDTQKKEYIPHQSTSEQSGRHHRTIQQ